MVYEPREDSKLLAKQVEKYAKGNVIDVGTGTGIQALAAKNTDKVCGVDIDPEAVKVAQENGVEATESDMFENVAGKFDTIICNTPYLPNEPKAPDVALDGGIKGYEWTLRFLEECKKHLEKDGQILMLISTLTGKQVVEKYLLENNYDWEIVGTQKLSFEELLVYRIKFALPDHPDAKYLAKGKRSKVYRIGSNVIKVSNPKSVAREAKMLQKVNEMGMGPKYVSNTEDTITMEYIEGERIDKAEKTEEVINQILEQLEKLDKEGIDKSELTNPYKHIIITEKGPVLIDWERATFKPRTQNVNQFKEYIKKIKKDQPA